MSKKIQTLFNSIAPRYDLLNSLLSLGVDRRWRRKAVLYLHSGAYQKVLDLCAGTLVLSKKLLKIHPQVLITALDFSEEMLAEGIKNLPKQFQSRIKTVCGDFFKINPPLPTFGDRRKCPWHKGGLGGFEFDGVMCAYGMRNLDDNKLALQKIHELLRPGGRIVILEFFRPDRWYSHLFHWTYAQFVIPTIGRLISRDKVAYEHLRDSVRGFYSMDEYVALLKEVGFTIKVAQQLTGGVSGLIVGDRK